MTHHKKARELVERLRGLEVCYLYAEEAAILARINEPQEGGNER